jgi:enamine deaminase RidA (YjgF/YER057c/UK114 family)
MTLFIQSALAGLLGFITTAVCALDRGGVVRYPIPGSDFPIAAAVEVPASANLVFLSGAVPPLMDRVRDSDRFKEYGGDTEDQTVDVIHGIERSLKGLGLNLGDIVKMQVFLVGDPVLEGAMDFAGFMRGYAEFFGTVEQPNVPARSVFQVARLADPSWLVEIEVTAVRPIDDIQ